MSLRRDPSLLQKQYDEALARSRFGHLRTEAGADYFKLYRTLQKKTGDTVPSKAALMSEIPKRLSDYRSVYEIVGKRDVRLTEAGAAIEGRRGAIPADKNWLDFIEPPYVDMNWWFFKRMVKEPYGCVTHVVEHYEEADLIIEFVSFPFANDKGDPHFVITVGNTIDPALADAPRGAFRAIGQALGNRGVDIGLGIPADVFEYRMSIEADPSSTTD